MTTNIVTVNVTQTVAPIPDELQKTGALISQGGTITSPGTKTLLTQSSDLDPWLKAPAAITSAAWSGITVQLATITTTQVHGLPVGDTMLLTLAGISSTTVGAYNGTWLCTITDTTHFTFTLPLSGAPGSGTGGTWATANSIELSAMVNTFFGQGAQQGVYILELGSGNPAQGVEFLTNWIDDNPNVFYSYLVPRAWDAQPTYLEMLSSFENTTSKTYFFTTTTLATYTAYENTMKSCFAMVEAPKYDVWPANVLTNLTFAAGWGANAFTNLVWAPTNGGEVTATTTTAHGVLPGQTFVAAGTTPSGYDGTFVALPGTTGSTLIWALTTDPGTDSVLGGLVAAVGGYATGTTTTAHTVVPGQTFVLAGSVGATIADGYNGTHIALPGTTASTLVFALAANPGTSTIDGTLVASMYASAGVPVTEFSAAAPFWVTLNYKPSTTNKVTPTAFSYLFGVTAYPTPGNQATLQLLQNASINVVGAGSEGGISNTILRNGTTMDGRDFTYWYSVDWVQITVQQAIANAIINGSNTPLNPLYYNQDGINRLQQVVVRTMNSGLSFGLVLGAVNQTQLDGTDFATKLDNGDFAAQTVVNAVPFVPYSQANPSHYRLGEYDGLAVVYTPTRGFIHIVFNVNVTDFVTA